MKAFKKWHNVKNFIHKNTTNELDVTWTENIEDALDADDLYIGSGLPSFSKAARFFFDELGFSTNPSKYDALHLL